MTLNNFSKDYFDVYFCSLKSIEWLFWSLSHETKICTYSIYYINFFGKTAIFQKQLQITNTIPFYSLPCIEMWFINTLPRVHDVGENVHHRLIISTMTSRSVPASGYCQLCGHWNLVNYFLIRYRKVIGIGTELYNEYNAGSEKTVLWFHW